MRRSNSDNRDAAGHGLQERVSLLTTQHQAADAERGSTATPPVPSRPPQPAAVAPAPTETRSAVLTVFFEGTANTLDPLTTQVGLFAHFCDAEDVTHRPPGSASYGQRPLKMAFDGCGVTDGCAGTLFACGLRKQCALVRSHVDGLVTQRWGRGLRPPLAEGEAAAPLTVNAVGLSRGGIACLYLAQALAHYPRSSVELSICMIDPVPGNLLATAQLDICRFTVTKDCCDVSSSQCLVRALALYPYEPLPALACHGPVLCKYPAWCDAEEEVSLGCHQGAMQIVTLRHPSRDPASALMFLRIRRFLEENGSPLLHQRIEREVCKVAALEDAARRACDRAVAATGEPPCTRDSHSAGSLRGAVIERAAAGTAQYMNHHHQLLVGGATQPARPGHQEDGGGYLLRVRRDLHPTPWGLVLFGLAITAAVVWIAVHYGSG
eukprot:TRINITY_DN21158_c0_g1_i1.p1 TRINITY_DN21158_c0_g1~~TRINITY_DN21158_c0_g1_i1.p1  ORF type:complete len:436 (+),score=71.66 TRINITY_DN21158_c0_g1_i1:137-1444(+)